jgi:hypothetical protein
MNFPPTAKEAAKAVENRAKRKRLSVAAYCELRGVDPSVITYWRTKYKSYRVSTYMKLMG